MIDIPNSMRLSGLLVSDVDPPYVTMVATMTVTPQSLMIYYQLSNHTSPPSSFGVIIKVSPEKCRFLSDIWMVSLSLSCLARDAWWCHRQSELNGCRFLDNPPLVCE